MCLSFFFGLFVCLSVCFFIFVRFQNDVYAHTHAQRVMETAEQAALSDSERDAAHHHHHHQAQTQHRLYETRHLNDYLSDDSKDLPPKPMRRFEKLVVNLTHSSVLVPAGISLSGMKWKQCNWLERKKSLKAKCLMFFNMFLIENRFQCPIVGDMVNTFRSNICEQFGTRCRSFMAILWFDKWFFATLSRYSGKEIDRWFSHTGLVHSGSIITQGHCKFQSVLQFCFILFTDWNEHEHCWIDWWWNLQHFTPNSLSHSHRWFYWMLLAQCRVSRLNWP